MNHYNHHHRTHYLNLLQKRIAIKLHYSSHQKWRHILSFNMLIWEHFVYLPNILWDFSFYFEVFINFCLVSSLFEEFHLPICHLLPHYIQPNDSVPSLKVIPFPSNYLMKNRNSWFHHNNCHSKFPLWNNSLNHRDHKKLLSQLIFYDLLLYRYN